MSKRSDDNPALTVNADGSIEPAPMEVEVPRRAASLTLRGADDARSARAASMEAANKSLAEALRITYVLILVVMVVMVLLFAFSGFQSVNESERGIKVRLGDIVDADLQPGFQLSLPYPLGEIIKVPTGQVTLQLDEAFWPKLPEDARDRPLDQAGYGQALRPGVDGSLITADNNLVHAQWTIVYSRAKPADYKRNILTDDESRIVMAVVKRAVVRAVAEVPIDDLLKRGAGRSTVTTTPVTPPPDAASPTTPPTAETTDAKPAGAPAAEAAPAAKPAAAPATTPAAGRENDIEARVRRLAQEGLDAIEAGLQIDSISLRSLSPPIRVIADFRKVQDAEAVAGRKRDEALQERNRILNSVAGIAYAPLLELIDAYGKELDLKETAKAEKTLDEIFAIIEGKRDGVNSTVNGKTYPDFRTSGEISTLISGANQFRSTIVEEAKQQNLTFAAKLQQYRANPRVFLVREWSEGLTSLLASGNVETFLLPDGTKDYEIFVNSDPAIKKAIQQDIQKKEVDKSYELRRALEAGKIVKNEEKK